MASVAAVGGSWSAMQACSGHGDAAAVRASTSACPSANSACASFSGSRIFCSNNERGVVSHGVSLSRGKRHGVYGSFGGAISSSSADVLINSTKLKKIGGSCSAVDAKYADVEVESSSLMTPGDIKNLKLLADWVFIKVAEAEKSTAGGILLTESMKEKPSIGTVVAVGKGPLGVDGQPRPADVAVGDSVMFSRYAGQACAGADGNQYVIIRIPELLSILS